MIYSKLENKYIPVQITSSSNYISNYGLFTRYQVKDKRIPIGYVDLRDTKNGVYVEFIKNQNPDLYTKFGELADQIEVEHCLKRGLKNFEIKSHAGLNSHALHFLRGKRFVDELINKTVENIIKNTPKGALFNTKSLKKVEMYMPQDLIKKYLKLIKRNPLILK